MKKILFFAGILMLIMACSTEKVNFSQLQDRNGLFYLMNKDKPFTGDVISYQNGKTEFEGKIEKGLRTGNWIYYYSTGQKKAEGNYNEGLKDGNWTTWTENGQQIAVEAYKYGKYVKSDGTPAMTGKTDSVINPTAFAVNSANASATSDEQKSDPGAADKKTAASGTTKSQPAAKSDPKPKAVVWESLRGGPVKYYNGIPYTGPVIKYFKGPGGVEFEGYFTGGHKTGKWTYYDRNGNVKNVKFY